MRSGAAAGGGVGCGGSGQREDRGGDRGAAGRNHEGDRSRSAAPWGGGAIYGETSWRFAGGQGSYYRSQFCCRPPAPGVALRHVVRRMTARSTEYLVLSTQYGVQN